MNSQNNSGGNNFQVGDAGKGNVFNVTQTGGQLQDIQLEVDQGGLKTFDLSDLRKDRLAFWLKSILAAGSAALGFASDAFGVSDKLGFSSFWIFGPAALALMFWCIRNFEGTSIIRALPWKKGEPAYLHRDKLVEKGDANQVFVYSRKAKCIYPRCHGNIVVVEAPPREKLRSGSQFAGVCSICDRAHSYRIDNVWNAFRDEEIDWSPLEEKKE